MQRIQPPQLAGHQPMLAIAQQAAPCEGCPQDGQRIACMHALKMTSCSQCWHVSCQAQGAGDAQCQAWIVMRPSRLVRTM